MRYIPGPAGRFVENTAEDQHFSAEVKSSQIVVPPITNVPLERTFWKGPWLAAIQMLDVELKLGPENKELLMIPETDDTFDINLNSVKNNFWRKRIETPIMFVIEELNFLTKDPWFIARDPWGKLEGSIHRKVFHEKRADISVGSVMVVDRVNPYCPTKEEFYLNIVSDNVLQIFKSNMPIPERYEKVIRTADDQFRVPMKRSFADTPSPLKGLKRKKLNLSNISSERKQFSSPSIDKNVNPFMDDDEILGANPPKFSPAKPLRFSLDIDSPVINKSPLVRGKIQFTQPLVINPPSSANKKIMSSSNKFSAQKKRKAPPISSPIPDDLRPFRNKFSQKSSLNSKPLVSSVKISQNKFQSSFGNNFQKPSPKALQPKKVAPIRSQNKFSSRKSFGGSQKMFGSQNKFGSRKPMKKSQNRFSSSGGLSSQNKFGNPKTFSSQKSSADHKSNEMEIEEELDFDGI